MKIHFGQRLPETFAHYKALDLNPQQRRVQRSDMLVPNPQKVRADKAEMLYQLSRGITKPD